MKDQAQIPDDQHVQTDDTSGQCAIEQRAVDQGIDSKEPVAQCGDANGKGECQQAEDSARELRQRERERVGEAPTRCALSRCASRGYNHPHALLSYEKTSIRSSATTEAVLRTSCVPVTRICNVWVPADKEGLIQSKTFSDRCAP